MTKRNFKFYLDYRGNRVEVTPYYTKLSIKTTKEQGQQFHRKSLDGDIKFVGKDFQLIYNESIDTEFTFLVVRLNSNGTRNTYYEGTFTKVDCKFNVSGQIAEPKFKTTDSYTKILDKYKDEYDLIKLGIPTEPITCTKRPFIQMYCAGASAITNIHNGQSWETDTASALEAENDIKKYGFSNIGTFREIYVEGAPLEIVNGIYNRFEFYHQPDEEHGYLDYYRWYKDLGTQTAIQAIWSYTEGLIQFGIYNGALTDILYFVPNLKEVEASKAWELKGNMTNLVFSPAAAPGYATVTKDFLYDIYGRIVHNKESEGKAIALDDFAISNVSYKRVTPLPSNFIIRQSAHSTLTKTPYGVNDYGEYFTPQWLPSDTDKYLPIARSSWVNTSIWLAYKKSEIDSVDTNYSQAYILRDAFNIGEAIKLILSQIDANISHGLDSTYSQFLYNPDFTLPNISERFYVYATQKTNMIKGTYDQAAQTGKISLESIMNMLRDCFKCYWYIENNKLKIEHISFFKNGKSYASGGTAVTDLRLLVDQFNKKPILLGQEAIEYDVSDLTRKYVFSFADESFLPFTGVDLEARASYIQQDKIEDISVNNFSADVDYMQISSESIAKDDFALLCPVLNGSSLELPIRDVQVVENGRPYTAMIQNALASWANLINLYLWDMPAFKINSNMVTNLQVQGLKECKTQEISIPYIANMTPFNKVRTDFGAARIDERVENIDTGNLKIKLIYPLS